MPDCRESDGPNDEEISQDNDAYLFDEECPQWSSGAAQTVSFTETEHVVLEVTRKSVYLATLH